MSTVLIVDLLALLFLLFCRLMSSAEKHVRVFSCWVFVFQFQPTLSVLPVYLLEKQISIIIIIFLCKTASSATYTNDCYFSNLKTKVNLKIQCGSARTSLQWRIKLQLHTLSGHYPFVMCPPDCWIKFNLWNSKRILNGTTYDSS